MFINSLELSQADNEFLEKNEIAFELDPKRYM